MNFVKDFLKNFNHPRELSFYTSAQHEDSLLQVSYHM